MTIYRVCGSCGEYSDNQLWTVAAYTTREMAELHAKLAQANAPTIFDYYRYHEVRKPNPYDPGMSTDYTGTRYHVEELQLHDHLDQYLETV